MESFNPQLQIGMQAMVINVHHEKNSHLIGKMVTVEALCDSGMVPGEWFNPVFENRKAEFALALVSGLGTAGGHKADCATIQQRHLMPLPPLDDDAIIFANENTKELEKC